jgi:hypothetical protein
MDWRCSWSGAWGASMNASIPITSVDVLVILCFETSRVASKVLDALAIPMAQSNPVGPLSKNKDAFHEQIEEVVWKLARYKTRGPVGWSA